MGVYSFFFVMVFILMGFSMTKFLTSNYVVQDG